MDSVRNLDGLRQRRSEILELAKRRKAHNIRVFGSVADGQAEGESVTSTSW